MRTIRLSEHESLEQDLTAAELQQLLSLPAGLVKVSAGRRGGLYRIKPYSRVGTLTLPALRILIRPKVGLRNVLFLLAYANRIRWGAEDFLYAQDDDLLRAIAWWFDRESASAARFGLSHGYVDREAALTTLRGRLALGRQLAQRPGQRTPLECEWQDYSEDIHAQPRGQGGPPRATANARARPTYRYPPAPPCAAAPRRRKQRRIPASALPPLAVTRLNRHWESALCLAQMILRCQSLIDEHGRVMGTSFTVDMNVLFERFVRDARR